MTGSRHWQSRRVLVTGCTGLLGTVVVRELLAKGADVVGLVRDRVSDGDFARDSRFRQVRLIHGRVEDRFRVQSALAVHEIQTVFHFAGATDDPARDRGTAAVLAAVQDHGPRITLLTARPLPTLGLAQPAGKEHSTSHVPWGIAEFGEIFGAGDRKTYRVVPATIIGHLTGDQSLPFPDAGAPRDFVYAPDAARACLALAESVAVRAEPGEVVAPFRTGWAFSDRDMAAVVRLAIAEKSLPQIRSGSADRPFGWAPETSLSDAVRKTTEWYRDFLKNRFFGTRPSVPPRRAAA